MSLSQTLKHNANLLATLLRNLDNSGKLHFITHGAGCLILRQFLALTDNYRIYNIADLGPMLSEITPQKALDLPKLPKEILHGIIFYPPVYTQLLKKLLRRYEGFPFLTPPSESSYAEKICRINRNIFFSN